MEFLFDIKRVNPKNSLCSSNKSNHKLLKEKKIFNHRIKRIPNSKDLIHKISSYGGNLKLIFAKIINSKCLSQLYSTRELIGSKERKSGDLERKEPSKLNENLYETVNKSQGNNIILERNNISKFNSLEHKLISQNKFIKFHSKTGRYQNNSMNLNIPNPQKLGNFENNSNISFIKIFNEQ